MLRLRLMLLLWLSLCLTGAWGSAMGSDAQGASNLKAAKPLKVFLLVGQSNMQGHAAVKTFPAMALDPITAPLLKEMQSTDGQPKVCERVWISSLGSASEEKSGQLTIGYGAEPGGPKIGPELMFGITMGKLLDEPILLIKTAWGGKSLHTDFRPPSAGPYPFQQQQIDNWKRQGKDVEALKAAKEEATGHYYRLMVEHIRKVTADIGKIVPGYDPNQGYELSGLVWFQGWNDMVDRGTYPNRGQADGYAAYSKVFAHFIRDVRKDLGVPDLPFVIGVMGAGGPTKDYGREKQRYAGIHNNFRAAMAAPALLPEFDGTVTAVMTENCWDMQWESLETKAKTLEPQWKALQTDQKEGKITRAEMEAMRTELYANLFSPEELETYRNSISNAEFHYRGSAKTLARIGKAFAEAMHELCAR